MGLLVEFDLVKDFGFMTETPKMKIPIDYEEGMTTFETVFMDTIDDLCPVDTGFLHDSIQVETDDTSIKAWTDCEYAQYVEYGTWKQSAQPYFQPALEEALNEAMQPWQDAMEEAMEEEQEELQERLEQEQAEAAQDDDDFEGGGNLFGGGITTMIAILIATAIVENIKQMFNFDDVRDYGKSSKGDKDMGDLGMKIFIPKITIT